ncbi:MAG: hypothetical protein EBT18_09450, partial [Gammaproteobacteria bacterium]|nr:hypothetical protein [Gammaproteobacteria bacterium]
RLAAEQGDATAQYNLAAMYDNGKGVPQDYEEAVKWYSKSLLTADDTFRVDPAVVLERLTELRDSGLDVPHYDEIKDKLKA